MKKVLYALLLLAVIFTSCKKNKNEGGDLTGGQGTTNASALNLLQDSVYAYAREEYLWYDALPDASVFKPRQFTGSSDGAALQAEIDAFTQLKKNPSTNQAYEYDADYPNTAKYSYIDEGQAATSIGGTGGDLGFYVFYQTSSDLRVKYVLPGSPASTAGLVRGYKITAINDNSSLAYTSKNDPVITFVGNALAANSIKLTLQRPDNTTFTTTVNKGTYTINPVMKYNTVTTASGKKVGYFAFKQFTTKANAQAKIDEAFNSFIANGITELVVDLRYNGGGAVETSEYLANYIVPAAKNGTLMYTENFNSKLQAGVYPLLAKKYSIPSGYFSLAKNTFNFAKIGTLNLSRVFFLVTGNTASASELLINNLNPVMNVQIIGQTSYGKPVGFFGIPVGKYDLYISEFESRNSDTDPSRQANFYQGMIPGSNFLGALANDDFTKDFGDPTEGMFAKAINYIEKGNYTVASLRTTSISANEQNMVQEANHVLDVKQHEFKGAVRTKDLNFLH